MTTSTTIGLTVTLAEDSHPVTPMSESGASPFVIAAQLDETTTLESHVTTDETILADKDYLDYLSMPYVSAIVEAFDDDGSGFVRISEVNEFCAQIPKGWTLLQW